MKIKKISFIMVILLSAAPLISCSNDNNQSSKSKIEQNQQIEDNVDKINTKESTESIDSSDNTESIDTSDFSPDETKGNNISQEDETPNTVTKIEGRRSEFIKKLDNIQAELDSLPIKKDSDAGVTNAMRSFYGISYDMYDKELNEIYALLKEQLSPETMQNLQNEQIKWIEKKEATATNEAEKYKGGSFEFVAYNSSLYGTTKNRCYELVNNYMTD